MKTTSSRTFVTRSKRNKKKYKRRRLMVLIISCLILVITFLVIRYVHIKSSCKDLDYAVEHYLTSGKNDQNLLRVKTMTLIFSDNDKAVVQAFGLSQEDPHREIGIEGHFKKDSVNSWKLESTYSIEN